jgi:dTDP-4-dehydrorhamnose reductase
MNTMQNILITGADGQLGMTFKSLILDGLDSNLIFTNSKDLDITNHQIVRKFILDKKINVIINCAAYTLVDKAEIEANKADQINHLAVANLSQVAKDLFIKLIHISTDYVFDGSKSSPYVESDPTNPQTVYGKTKLNGEIAIKKINPKDSIIIRTSWLFSRFGKNFVNKILELAKTNKQISIVSDQIGSPTYANDLARVILKIIPKIKNNNVELFHFSNEGSCSWYEFAKEIFKMIDKDTVLIPVSSHNFKSNANRPYFSVLSSDKIKNKYKFAIPIWKNALKDNFELVNE